MTFMGRLTENPCPQLLPKLPGEARPSRGSRSLQWLRAMTAGREGSSEALYDRASAALRPAFWQKPQAGLLRTLLAGRGALCTDKLRSWDRCLLSSHGACATRGL